MRVTCARAAFVLFCLAVALIYQSGWAANLPNAFRPAGAAAKWSDLAMVAQELPLVGDFDGNGRDDLILFERETRGQQGQCIVMLSEGNRFGIRTAWIDRTCMANEWPVIGDFNGDHKDDIAVFPRGAGRANVRGPVRVALSEGPHRFAQATVWRDHVCADEQVPLAGDFNGDGRDDIVVFVRSKAANPVANPLLVGGEEDKTTRLAARQESGNVFVWLNGKSGFGNPALWQAFFCVGNETPKVADFDGNGKDDIATFVPDRGEVYVALSDGTRFGEARVWKTNWAERGQIPGVGCFNDDRLADLVQFDRTPPGSGDFGNVYVALNQFLPAPQHFGDGVLRHNLFCIGQETPLVGDFNGDRRDDICTLVGDLRGEPERGDCFVATSHFGEQRSWRFKLDTLTSSGMSERPVIGHDGDEPYFVLIGFRSRFSTPGSTRVWRVNNPYEFAVNVCPGARVAIPPNMGECRFDNVQAFTIADGCQLRRPEVMGCLVMCLEHDNSSFSVINAMAQRAIDQGLAPALTNLIERRPIPMTPDATQQLITDATNLVPTLTNALQPTTGEILGIFLDAVGDADDLVNYHVFLTLAADPECAQYVSGPMSIPSQVTFSILDSRRWAGNEALRFEGSNQIDPQACGSAYRVDARFEMLP